MTLEVVRAVLASEIGLAADVLGATTLERAAQERMRSLGTATIAEYADRLRRDLVERAALIEEVVVPETWFFRDREPFRVIARSVRDWTPGRRLRVLSVPCSTGEEPYSVVMTLVDDGFDLARLEVVAVDVSVRALDRARQAVYGRHSFRGDLSLVRTRHFSPLGDRWVLDPRLRERVELVRGNALALGGTVRGRFDVILCRNLLIYLTAESRVRVLTSLVELLADDGTLVVGHADLIDGAAFGLAMDGDPSGFAYRRAAVAVPTTVAVELSPPPVTGVNLGRPPAAAPATPVPPASPPPAADGAVERARLLADRGELAAAATLLTGHLERLGPDGEAYHLLGVIESARGDRALAEKYLARALYCDPGNQASLLHLALLAEQRGDAAAAANFRRRAHRLRGGRS